MNKVVIVSAQRTPVGKFRGKLSNYSAVELGTAALKSAINKIQLDPKDIENVIFGNVVQAGTGQNAARQIAVNAGLPYETPGMTVNEVCGSGLKSIILGKQLIQLGEANVVAVGGIESMTNTPDLVLKKGDAPVKSFMHDGLTDVFHNMAMGLTAEAIATKYEVTREEQDTFALNSHLKSDKATKAGKFNEEIVPLEDVNGETITSDELIRPESTIEDLATLKTIFKEDGTVTAGNASALSDGGSALILMSESYAKEHGYTILATVGQHAEIGCDPLYMGYAPFYAVESLLNKTGKTIQDIDLVEMTEAFSAQSIPVKKNLNIPDEKFNIYGGAIALGHPLGSTGSRLVTTLAHALKQEDKQTGIATACIGGGLGIALMIEKGVGL
ncbi:MULTISPECIES: thiolase family protein [Mammaliicoccus]|jgi:acetyl-CoA C-acetyltransferase|uniref:Probable acetyl-CoA acyltransferase n=1 Tax=Mammaliicoccus sciuri TaxID=1296 RepID=A0AB37HME4_MAMSC|nr:MULTISPECIES: thiolase family protein [Mammaliicoccus]HDK8090627.1 thiolase family protein [Staphylococcus aureus]ARB39751.1 3-ketoacyl-CoA thiolase [Mammaliicoccus sciuri]MCE4980839.1 thiolase family protein [Mammaliicoccus sciuri]MCE5041269.1 thiolase family protein [Mammaliicoccus sciuri]MCE5085605.1 thiolase family protein [Mammaliicoccus sciuri]